MRLTFPKPKDLSGNTLLAELVEAFGKPQDLRVKMGQPNRFDVSVNRDGDLEVVVPDGTKQGAVAKVVAAHKGPSETERADLIRRFGPLP